MAKPTTNKTMPAKGNGGKLAAAPQAAPAKVIAKPAPKAAAPKAPAPKAAAPKAAAPKAAAAKVSRIDANSPEVRGAIAQRAFELSQARGGQPGHELEDWLIAEREILSSQARA